MTRKGELMSLRRCGKKYSFRFFSSYFKQKIAGWYASMPKFELKLDQFGAFGAAWCQEVQKFPVKSAFFL